MSTAKAATGVAIHDFRAYPTDEQAGGHPDIVVKYLLDNRFDTPLSHPCKCNDPKDIIVDFPAGVLGAPHAYPRCRIADFSLDICPIDSQIGAVRIKNCELEAEDQVSNEGCYAIGGAVYNLIPDPGKAGLVGFKAPVVNTPIFHILTARTGSDYGLRAITRNLQRSVAVQEFTETLWGVPADSKNDAPPGEPPVNGWNNYSSQLQREDGTIVGRWFPGPNDLFAPVGTKSNWPLRPFTLLPTSCNAGLETRMRVVGYDGGVTEAVSPWPASTGCEQLSFEPSLAAKPTTTEADAPSGVDIVLAVPQFQSPSVPSSAQIRTAKIVLPTGFSINPNAATGKVSCTDAQARFGTELQAECPEYAKVGTLEIHSAVLPSVLPGALYLGEPLPGNRYRLFIVADGFGLHVKLPGTVTLDPGNGQVTTLFDDLPETPFERFNLHIFGAERGILATPTECGIYPVRSTFTAWNDSLPPKEVTQFFEITSGPLGAGCPEGARPFAPRFEAASASNDAGSYSPYGVDLARRDGDQFLSGLEVATPMGFSGKLAGVAYCPEPAIARASNPLYSGIAELNAAACPAASQIGTVVAGAGAGSRPLYQTGKAYLAGPYEGAPLSLFVVVPAVSGPYDLGNVAVRVAIHVDPSTARVSAVADELPQIVEGIPLRTRSIRVDIDREDFALNPTNCRPLSTDATVFGDQGAGVSRSYHYQAANCAILPFGPELSLRYRGETKRAGHPAIRSVLNAAPGEANIRRVAVTLPDSQLIDNAHITNPCTRVQYAADSCPKSAITGFARAWTPLLDEPLQGPVYLRSSSNKLPDLVADLRGQIRVELAGRVDAVRGRIRTTFETVPDVPVSRFVLDLEGGDSGLLFNTANLCRRANVTTVRIAGQNGARADSATRVRTPCGKRKEARRSHSHLSSARKAAHR